MKTYLVGGAVRDQLLNYPFHEKDWVVVFLFSCIRKLKKNMLWLAQSVIQNPVIRVLKYMRHPRLHLKKISSDAT